MKKFFSLSLVLLLFLFACKEEPKQEKKPKPQKKEVVAPPKKVVEDTIKKPEPMVDTLPKAEIKKEQKKYYLIIGSFLEFENAKKLNNTITGSEILVPVNKFNRVAKAVFTDRDEAIKAKDAYRQQHSDVAAWIYYY